MNEQKENPIKPLRMMTDTRWQEMCLLDRVKNPEVYAAAGEDRMAAISRIGQWFKNKECAKA